MISYLYGQRINKESESSTVPRRGNHAPKGRRVMGERRAVSLETLQGRAPVELRTAPDSLLMEQQLLDLDLTISVLHRHRPHLTVLPAAGVYTVKSRHRPTLEVTKRTRDEIKVAFDSAWHRPQYILRSRGRNRFSWGKWMATRP